MKAIRIAALTTLVAAAGALAAAPAPAGGGFAWEMTPSSVSCFTNQNNVTGYLVEGSVATNLPPSPPATIAVALRIDGGGAIALDPTAPTFSVGVSASLPFTSPASFEMTLSIDGADASVQTLTIDCTQSAPPTGESYPGQLLSNELVLSATPPTTPPAGSSGGGGTPGNAATPAADAVGAAPRLTG